MLLLSEKLRDESLLLRLFFLIGGSFLRLAVGYFLVIGENAEQQRLALGKLLLTEPDILLLDEPTKGLDGAFKEKLAEFLKDLCSKGKTVVLVSHDMEFCARYADQCGLLFDGQLISEGETRAFFRENVFYTTAAQRMSRGVCGDCLLAEDIVRALQEAGCAG